MHHIISAFRHSASITVEAPPDVVWDLVTDVPRMGEWSPICRRCEWLGDAQEAALHARFKGYNRYSYWRWARECVVTAFQRPALFAFHTEYNGEEHTRWRYELEPDNGRTRVTESYESVAMPGYVRLLYSGPHIRRARLRANARGMDATLQRIKAEAEATAR